MCGEWPEIKTGGQEQKIVTIHNDCTYVQIRRMRTGNSHNTQQWHACVGNSLKSRKSENGKSLPHTMPCMCRKWPEIKRGQKQEIDTYDHSTCVSYCKVPRSELHHIPLPVLVVVLSKPIFLREPPPSLAVKNKHTPIPHARKIDCNTHHQET